MKKTRKIILSLCAFAMVLASMLATCMQAQAATKVSSVALNQKNITLNVGKTSTLKATVKPSSMAKKVKLTWATSNKAVATVSSQGKITAKKAGTATITVQVNGTSKKATCKVTVTTPVTGVKFDAVQKSVAVGKTFTLKASISPSNASNKAVTYTSSNKKVATVSASGVVKGIGKGTATITAVTKDGKKKATCKVSVLVPVKSIALNTTAETLEIGKKLQLEATVSPSDASDKEVVYTSSNKEVATVTADGLVEAVGSGKTTIMVTTKDGSQKVTCEITVAEPVYVLMNIPYAKFYASEVNNDIPVDVFSSATKSKTRTTGLSGGSYHESVEQINGITYPVKVLNPSVLAGYKKVTDEDTISYEVTNRGQTTTVELKGKETLYENSDYAYYLLNEAPAYYKEMQVAADGAISFGASTGNVENVALDASGYKFSTTSSYGDYQLSLTGFTQLTAGTDDVYAVVIETKEGDSYGLRHLENIWRVTELAWCSTDRIQAVHNCPTSYAHYAKMVGQTITNVIYYTSKGIYNVSIPETKVVPHYSLSAQVSADHKAISLSGIPADAVNATATISYTVGEGREAVETKIAENLAIVDGSIVLDTALDASLSATYKVTVSCEGYGVESTSVTLAQ